MKEKSIDDYDRVTKILYPFSGLDKISPHILQNAARRGSKVHKIIEGIELGIGEYGVDAEVKGYMDSFYAWWNPDMKIIEIEKRFFDDELNLTGQADLIVEEDGILILRDYKTSAKPSSTWKVQGSAYVMLARKAGYDIQKVEFIHLNRYGHPAYVSDLPIDITQFLDWREKYNTQFRHLYE